MVARMVKIVYKLEEVYSSNIGAVFMIDRILSDILLKIDRSNIYDYVIYGDEMTFMIDDIIEMECYWYDIELMFRYCRVESLFFSGKVISDSIKENGCLAVIKNTPVLKKNLEMLMKIDCEEMKRAYIVLKDKMVNNFESIWEFLEKLKRFYLKAILFNRSILLFC